MFQSYQLIQITLIQQVLEAIDGRYLSCLRNRVTIQAPNNIRSLILNVFLLYSNITPQQLNVKKSIENMKDQLLEPINVIFLAVEDLQGSVELAGRPFTPQEIVDIGYLIVSKHRIFISGILKWLRQVAINQT